MKQSRFDVRELMSKARSLTATCLLEIRDQFKAEPCSGAIANHKLMSNRYFIYPQADSIRLIALKLGIHCSKAHSQAGCH